jgi:hypothetical protein
VRPNHSARLILDPRAGCVHDRILDPAYRKRLSGYMQLAVYAVVAPDAIEVGLVPLAFVAVTVQV